MPKITIEVSDVEYKLLQVLDEEGSVEAAVELLLDHAQQGVYRPGAWERPWLVQVFGEDFIARLEPGNPYGRPESPGPTDRGMPMFRRPKTNPAMSVYGRPELAHGWTLIVCNPHVAEFGTLLHQHGFRLGGPAPADHKVCAFCFSGQKLVNDIEACTCATALVCTVHKAA
jgi:hypothetical protein